MNREDELLKKDFDKLTDRDKIDVLFEYIRQLESVVFDNQQRIDHFESETQITPEERLQRKEVWSKTEVCDYFGWTTKTFERNKKAGEIRVVKVGGKDYCRLIDLKDRFADKGEYPPFERL